MLNAQIFTAAIFSDAINVMIIDAKIVQKRSISFKKIVVSYGLDEIF